MAWRRNCKGERATFSLGGSMTEHLNKTLKWSQESSVSVCGDYILPVHSEKKSLGLYIAKVIVREVIIKCNMSV